MLLDLVAYLFGLEVESPPPPPPPIVEAVAEASGGILRRPRLIGVCESIAPATLSTGRGTVRMVGRVGAIARGALGTGTAQLRTTGRGVFAAPLTRTPAWGQIARAGELIVVVEADVDEDVQVVLRA